MAIIELTKCPQSKKTFFEQPEWQEKLPESGPKKLPFYLSSFLLALLFLLQLRDLAPFELLAVDDLELLR